jgi:hypothetical protein
VLDVVKRVEMDNVKKKKKYPDSFSGS